MKQYADKSAIRPMNIVCFIPSLELGGIERMRTKLLNGLDKYGYKITVVTARSTGPLRHKLAPNVQLLDLNKNSLLACFIPLTHVIRRLDPDVIISGSWLANTLCLAARILARARAKVIISEHSTLSVRFKYNRLHAMLAPVMIRMFYPLADAVIAVSHGVADDLWRLSRLERRPTVIYNPAMDEDLVRIGERIRSNHGGERRSSTLKTIVSVSRMSSVKDHITLLDAFAVVCTRIEARLIIVGDGPERCRIKDRIEQLGIGKHVELRGNVVSPFEIVAQADLLVLSSKYEGFGNVLVEAMALGCPVVSTDCPHGPREILCDGRYGTLVPVGDPEKLGRAMVDTLCSPPQRAMLVERSRAFSDKRHIEKYMTVISSVLS